MHIDLRTKGVQKWGGDVQESGTFLLYMLNFMPLEFSRAAESQNQLFVHDNKLTTCTQHHYSHCSTIFIILQHQHGGNTIRGSSFITALAFGPTAAHACIGSGL
jgi:hypothetical protein